MSETATDRVRLALASGEKPKRADLSHFFRDTLGMTKRVAEAYAAAFVRAELAADDPPADPEALALAKGLLDVISRG